IDRQPRRHPGRRRTAHGGRAQRLDSRVRDGGGCRREGRRYVPAGGAYSRLVGARAKPTLSPPPGLARRGISLYRGTLRMGYRILADTVVLAHVVFVGFVLLGGFLVWRWGWVAWAHVPAAIWGAAIEY